MEHLNILKLNILKRFNEEKYWHGFVVWKSLLYCYIYAKIFEGSDGNMNIYLYIIRIICKGYLAKTRKGNK